MLARKLFGFFMILVLMFSLTAFVTAEEVEIPKAQYPAFVTSAGQSPDDNMVRVLATRLGIQVSHNPLVKVEDLEGYKTLMIAIGGSAKGLGDAGIDIRDEVARIGQLLDKYDEWKEEYPGEYLVVGIHIGGEGRRGDLSQSSIDATAPRVDLLIVWEEGDSDGMFTKIAEDNDIPLIILSAVRDLQNVLAEMFADELDD